MTYALPCNDILDSTVYVTRRTYVESLRVKMPVEETLLDPPITPAPIFAYRAIKGWFVGSPDSSPERDNKENVPTINICPKSLNGGQGLNTPRLSPNKRKRDSEQMVSPTKSILRTPGGGPTPRAKSLREVNVKFKSVSLSPDVRRKDLPAGGTTEKPKGKRPQTTTKHEKASGKALPAKPAHTSTDIEPQETLVIAASTLDPDHDEHFRRTAKEMKRLLKYGHKWREVARQMDEDNAKLRLLLAEAQQESKRLESLLQRGGRPVERARITGKVVEGPGKNTSGTTTAKDAVTATGAAIGGANSASSNAAAQDLEDLLDLTPPTETFKAGISSQHPISAPTNKPLAPSNPLPTRLPRTSVPQRPASISTSVPTHSPLTVLQHRIEGSVPVPSTAARTNLPADRIAAVRKRLMAKEQARKGGLSVLDEIGAERDQGFGVAGVGVGKGTEMPDALDGSSLAVGGKQQQQRDVEESGLDWVGV